MAHIRDLRRASLATTGLLAAAMAPAWAGSTERVSIGPHGRQANGYSDDVSISADGRFAAFDSAADNLVEGDTNGSCDEDGICALDIFVRDREAGRTERVNL